MRAQICDLETALHDEVKQLNKKTTVAQEQKLEKELVEVNERMSLNIEKLNMIMCAETLKNEIMEMMKLEIENLQEENKKIKENKLQSLSHKSADELARIFDIEAKNENGIRCKMLGMLAKGSDENPQELLTAVKVIAEKNRIISEMDNEMKRWHKKFLMEKNDHEKELIHLNERVDLKVEEIARFSLILDDKMKLLKGKDKVIAEKEKTIEHLKQIQDRCREEIVLFSTKMRELKQQVYKYKVMS